MRILALETSTEAGSCAFWHDGTIVSLDCPAGRPHSETLLPLVQQLMKQAQLAFSDLDAIAFGAGPGAFTGLRVACGVAQGLAVAADIPVVPVTTLAALASQVEHEHVLTLIDARMNEVYVGRYQHQDTDLKQCGELVVAGPDAVPLPEGDAWVACGNAISAYPGLAQRLNERGISWVSGLMPTAAAVARLAARLYAEGKMLDPAMVAPLYVRDKVAQTVAERLASGGKA